jgi:hypothetical protein
MGQQWGARWLLNSGVFSDLAGDELIAMAYEPAVKEVKIEIDRDMDNGGEYPSVTYLITLTPFKYLLYRMSQLTGFGKILALLSSYLGAPIGIESRIAKRAVSYLPAQYTVLVRIL